MKRDGWEAKEATRKDEKVTAWGEKRLKRPRVDVGENERTRKMERKIRRRDDGHISEGGREEMYHDEMMMCV